MATLIKMVCSEEFCDDVMEYYQALFIKSGYDYVMVNSVFDDIRNVSWKYYRYKNKKKYYKLIINNDNNNLDIQTAKIKNHSKLKEIVAVLPYNPQYSHWKVELINHVVKCLSTTSTNKLLFPKSRFKLVFSNCGPTLGQRIYPKPICLNQQF